MREWRESPPLASANLASIRSLSDRIACMEKTAEAEKSKPQRHLRHQSGHSNDSFLSDSILQSSGPLVSDILVDSGSVECVPEAHVRATPPCPSGCPTIEQHSNCSQTEVLTTQQDVGIGTTLSAPPHSFDFVDFATISGSSLQAAQLHWAAVCQEDFFLGDDAGAAQGDQGDASGPCQLDQGHGHRRSRHRRGRSGSAAAAASEDGRRRRRRGQAGCRRDGDEGDRRSNCEARADADREQRAADSMAQRVIGSARGPSAAPQAPSRAPSSASSNSSSASSSSSRRGRSARRRTKRSPRRRNRSATPARTHPPAPRSLPPQFGPQYFQWGPFPQQSSAPMLVAGAPQTRRNRKPRTRKPQRFVLDFTEVVDSPHFDVRILEEAFPDDIGTMTLTEMLLRTRASKSQILKRLDVILDPRLVLLENGPTIFISEEGSAEAPPKGGPRPPSSAPPAPPATQRRKAHLMAASRVPKRYWSGATGSDAKLRPFSVWTRPSAAVNKNRKRHADETAPPVLQAKPKRRPGRNERPPVRADASGANAPSSSTDLAPTLELPVPLNTAELVQSISHVEGVAALLHSLATVISSKPSAELRLLRAPSDRS